MRRLTALLMALVMALPACDGLTRPDEDDMNSYMNAIAPLPEPMIEMLKRFGANRFAAGWLASQGEDSQVAEFKCYDADQEYPADLGSPATRIIIHARDVIACLNLHKTHVYIECVDHVMRRLAKDWTGADHMDERGRPWCHDELEYSVFFKPDADPNLDPSDIDYEEIMRALLRSAEPPPFLGPAELGALGVTAEQLIPFLVRLCALGEGGPAGAWSCPGSPLYPPGQTPQPQPPSGDR